eukprot:TRINITY_DN5666_c0_g2_i1.p1 TRINITY_DN5666_c0_g2~~TRINITY_DN5666_c0_g2_i1.p1  ORF type:complete len:366 (-),score=56.77 TRINITY_DN5666_c0_g2_i1:689-1786(-)
MGESEAAASVEARYNFHGGSGVSPVALAREVLAWPPPQLEPREMTFLEVVIVVFGLTSLLAARVLMKSDRLTRKTSSPVAAGLIMRRRFLCCIIVATACRFVDLVAELVMQEHYYPGGYGGGAVPMLGTHEQQYRRVLLKGAALFPTIVIASAFSIVGAFFVQIHGTTTMSPVHMLDFVLVSLNVFAYLFFLGLGFTCIFLQAYHEFLPGARFLLAMTNVGVALMLSCYGLMVASELWETARKKLPGRRLTCRTLLFSVICPVTLLSRGCYDVACVFTFAPMNMEIHLTWCLCAEFLPSVVAMILLRGLPGGQSSPSDPLNDSTDSEAPLLNDDEQPTPQRNLVGALGPSWKQIYPQPTAAGGLP